MGIIIPGILYMAALLVAYRMFDSNQFNKTSYASWGVIIGYCKRVFNAPNKSQGVVSYYPVIEYKYEDKQYRFIGLCDIDGVSKPIGAKTIIRVSNKNHSRARLAMPVRDYLVGVIFVVLISLVAGGLFTKFLNSPSEEYVLAKLISFIGLFLPIIIYVLQKNNIHTFYDLVNKFKKISPYGDDIIYNQDELGLEQESKTEKIKNSRKAKYFTIVFAFAGLLTTLGGLFLAYDHARFILIAERTVGMVVGIKEEEYIQDGHRRITYHAVVKFTPVSSSKINTVKNIPRVNYKNLINHPAPLFGRYEANINSKAITFVNAFGSSNYGIYSKRSAVNVLYDPDDVSNAMLDEGFRNWIIPLFLVIFGSIFMLVSFFSYKKENKKNKQSETLIDF